MVYTLTLNRVDCWLSKCAFNLALFVLRIIYLSQMLVIAILVLLQQVLLGQAQFAPVLLWLRIYVHHITSRILCHPLLVVLAIRPRNPLVRVMQQVLPALQLLVIAAGLLSSQLHVTWEYFGRMVLGQMGFHCSATVLWVVKLWVL